jgi:hypothetical protein
MKTRTVLLLVMVFSTVQGCKATDRYWSFPILSSGKPLNLLPMFEGMKFEGKGKGSLCMLPVVLTAPIWSAALGLAIDVALLPITIPHDLYIRYLRRKNYRPISKQTPIDKV